jgi:hypothetical protein
MSSTDTLHDEVMRDHPDILQCVESDVKRMFSEFCGMKVSPVCRAIWTTSSTSVALHEMFPVTLGARILDIRKDIQCPESQTFVIETRHHELVMMMAVGYTVVSKSEFTVAPFEQLQLTDDLCLSVSSKQATASSKNKQRKAPARKTVAVASLITVSTGCSMCGSLGPHKFPSHKEIRQFLGEETSLDKEEPQRTATKHLRCSRCWDKLRFPVWYCCRDCQVAHYPEHKRLCGKMPK